MLITINPDDPRPIYRQVVDALEALIARGELVEGTALPSVRQVAADLGVNLNTIATAYRELQSKGLLAIRHGSGAVVISRTAAARDEEELRTPLRTALTQLILAGWPRKRILNMVDEELRGLLKEAPG
jgi:GntR family transcriptional regulator